MVSSVGNLVLVAWFVVALALALALAQVLLALAPVLVPALPLALLSLGAWSTMI